jgi:HEAT repeats
MEDVMTEDPNPLEDRALFGALKAIPRPVPPTTMASEFREQTQVEPVAGRSNRLRLLVGIAALLLFAFGGAWWREARQIEKLQTAVARLSVTSRYEWIAAVADSGAADSRIVAALTKALLSDSSTNVRVAAAEALGRIATPTALRDAATRSIRSDSSPFVQAALLGAMTRLAPGDRATLIHILLSRPDLDPVVRSEAEAKTKS